MLVTLTSWGGAEGSVKYLEADLKPTNNKQPTTNNEIILFLSARIVCTKDLIFLRREKRKFKLKVKSPKLKVPVLSLKYFTDF